MKAILDSGIFTRDFGSKQETVCLNDTLGEHLCLNFYSKLEQWTEMCNGIKSNIKSLHFKFLISCLIE